MENNEAGAGTACSATGRVQTVLIAALFLAIVAVAVFLWMMAENVRSAADARANGLEQSIAALQETQGTLKLALDAANKELEVFDQLKTSLDSVLGEFSSRVATVEEKVPQQEQELEEFSVQMRELNQSVEQLSRAIAILRQERVTQEQLDQAREQLTSGIEGMKGAVKKLDRAHGAVVYRVRKLEKFQKETGSALEDLAVKIGEVRSIADILKNDVSELRNRPAPPRDDFHFVPSGKEEDKPAPVEPPPPEPAP